MQLRVGEQPLIVERLRPGTRRYVRYWVGSDGGRKLIDIWQRTISRPTALPGRPAYLRIEQRWDGAGGNVLDQDSSFDLSTFRPLAHKRRETRSGVTKLMAYRFLPGKVVGDTEVPGNERADFSMPLHEPVFNFENDMELLEILPLRAGVTYSIPFYDAGIDPKPDRYFFKVAGSEQIPGLDGRPVDCWLVTADYGTGKVVSRFWISKMGHLVLREAQLAKGQTLVKALLPAEAGS